MYTVYCCLCETCKRDKSELLFKKMHSIPKAVENMVGFMRLQIQKHYATQIHNTFPKAFLGTLDHKSEQTHHESNGP